MILCTNKLRFYRATVSPPMPPRRPESRPYPQAKTRATSPFHATVTRSLLQAQPSRGGAPRQTRHCEGFPRYPQQQTTAVTISPRLFRDDAPTREGDAGSREKSFGSGSIRTKARDSVQSGEVDDLPIERPHYRRNRRQLQRRYQRGAEGPAAGQRTARSGTDTALCGSDQQRDVRARRRRVALTRK